MNEMSQIGPAPSSPTLNRDYSRPSEAATQLPPAQAYQPATPAKPFSQQVYTVVDNMAGAVETTVRSHPLLMATGLAALGAIAGMAIAGRGRRGRETADRRLKRYAQNIDQKIRNELRGSTVANSIDSLAQTLSSSEAIVKPLVDRGQTVLARATKELR